MRSGVGVAVEVLVPGRLVAAAPLRAEDRVHLGELVGRRGGRHVGARPTGMPSRLGLLGGRPAVAHLELDLGRQGHVAAGVADQQPLLVGEVRGVDVGRVRVEQVEVAQRGQLALGVAEPVHRHVDRDVDAQLLGQLPLIADDVGLAEVRAARGQAPWSPARCRRSGYPRGASGRGRRRCARRCPCSRGRTTTCRATCWGTRTRTRSGCPCPGALDGGIGVVGRVHDVRPVDERRDARVDALQGAPAVRGQDIVRPVLRGELVEDARRSR